MPFRLPDWTFCAAAALAITTATGAAQSAPRSAFSTTVRVTLVLDSAPPARFGARDFELRVSRSDPSMPSATEIQIVKQAGAHTGSLVSLTSSGARIPSGVIDVLDSLDQPALTLRLTDIIVVSDHLSLSTARANLEQQRLSQQEALSALTADYSQAQRELATIEELNKTRGTTRMDLARARDRVTDLQRRIDLLKQRQALLASQQADVGSVDETIVLRFGRLEIGTR